MTSAKRLISATLNVPEDFISAAGLLREPVDSFGSRLFERAVVSARSQGVRMLFIHALAENDAMLKITRKGGAVVESYWGEVQAHLQLPDEALGQTIGSVVRDAAEDGLGEVDFQLKLSALHFWGFLASVQEVRQGVRVIEGETEA